MNDLMYVNGLIDRTLKTVRATSNLQSTDNGDREDVLQLLNEILAEMGAVGGLLPFQVVQAFDIQAGKSEYTIGSIVGASVTTTPFAVIDYVSLVLDDIRFPVEIQDDFAVYGHGMSLINQSRPGWVSILRAADYSKLTFYGVPDRNYVCEIRGKKDGGTIQFQDYLALPSWYMRFLRLALARDVNDYFNLSAWDESKERKYLEAEAKMLAAAKKDWSIKTGAPFRPGNGVLTYRLGVTS